MAKNERDRNNIKVNDENLQELPCRGLCEQLLQISWNSFLPLSYRPRKETFVDSCRKDCRVAYRIFSCGGGEGENVNVHISTASRGSGVLLPRSCEIDSDAI